MFRNETLIYNYRPVTENIASSGQPTADELSYISDAGYKIVINLGLHDTEYSIENEASFFKNKKITYINIPVVFDAPQPAELKFFTQTLDEYKENKVFIHCAANKRVSVFVALYRIISLGWPVDKALKEIESVWQPDDIWQSFINQQLLNR